MKMNEQSLQKYVEMWCAARLEEWKIIYQGISSSRRNGIYLLPRGAAMMDVLESVYDNYAEHLSPKNLLPVCFSSPHQLLIFLGNYREYCIKQLNWMQKLPQNVLSNQEVYDIIHMLDDVVEMATYCLNSYETKKVEESYNRPYVRMRECLLHNDIQSFISEINIILNEIPYSIYRYRPSEGRYHAIIHAVLFQLGFRVISEKTSNLGRLDLIVELNKYVYIFEFKYSKDGKKLSGQAIQQIKDKKYALSYLHTSLNVYAVGVTIGGDSKDIFDWESEKLN